MPATAYSFSNPVQITDDGNTVMPDAPHDLNKLYLAVGIVAFDSGVFKVQWSLDGITWVDTDLTLSANGVDIMADTFFVPGSAKMRLNVGSVAGAAMDAPPFTVRVAGAAKDAF